MIAPQCNYGVGIETQAFDFIENFANPNLFGKPTDADRVATAVNELLPPLLDYLNSQVPPEGYLFGHFSTADISIATPLFQAAYGGYEVDSKRWPRYAAFLRRVAQHPVVIDVREREKQAVEQMAKG